MAKNKTTETTGSVADFINTVSDEQKRKDSFAIAEIMAAQSGYEAKMWGAAIVGFGIYHYTYESGHSGEAPLVAFSPRANAISLYCSKFDGREILLEKFGKHKTGKGCIYIKKLSDIHIDVLNELIKGSVKDLKTKYPDAV